MHRGRATTTRTIPNFEIWVKALVPHLLGDGAIADEKLFYSIELPACVGVRLFGAGQLA